HRLTRGYERFLATALQRRTLLLCLVGALFVGSLSLTFGIGREFFPQVDDGQITIYVRTPSKFRLDTTEAATADVEKFWEEQIPASERQMIVSEIGLDPDWSAAYSGNSGQQDAVIRIQLSDARQYSAQRYTRILRHRMLEAPNRFGDL